MSKHIKFKHCKQCHGTGWTQLWYIPGFPCSTCNNFKPTWIWYLDTAIEESNKYGFIALGYYIRNYKNINSSPEINPNNAFWKCYCKAKWHYEYDKLGLKYNL